MKRTLVALAVAGAFLAPAAAMADGSGVTLSGVVHGDIGMGREKADDGTEVYKRQPNIGTFATRWNIDGTEDLGWAQAIFGLAMDQQFAGPNRRTSGGGINNNNNQASPSSIQNRNSYLGLTGGFGTVKIGQNEHLYEIQQILQDSDPASEVAFDTLTLMTDWGLGSGRQNFTRRDSQSIWYASPNFGGATVEAAYITPAGAKTSGLSPQGYQLGANWKAPFGLSLYGAFAQYDDFDGVDSKNRAMRLGVGYGMELFQVDVFGEQLKYTSSGVADKRTNIGVSGSLNFGQHHIRATYAVAGKLKQNIGDLSDSKAKLFWIGYAYTLSKRTELQVNYGKLDNEKSAQFGSAFGVVSAPGNDAERFGVGIRHTF